MKTCKDLRRYFYKLPRIFPDFTENRPWRHLLSFLCPRVIHYAFPAFPPFRCDKFFLYDCILIQRHQIYKTQTHGLWDTFCSQSGKINKNNFQTDQTCLVINCTSAQRSTIKIRLTRRNFLHFVRISDKPNILRQSKNQIIVHLS